VGPSRPEVPEAGPSSPGAGPSPRPEGPASGTGRARLEGPFQRTGPSSEFRPEAGPCIGPGGRLEAGGASRLRTDAAQRERAAACGMVSGLGFRVWS